MLFRSDHGLSGCSPHTYKVKVKTVNGDEATSAAAYATTICKAPFLGYVRFANGAPVVGAIITVRDPGTGQVLWRGTTDSAGYFESPELFTGRTYDLSAELPDSCWAETRYSIVPGWNDFTVVAICE